MTRLKLVQFWMNAEEHADNERLDAEILILRQRVWERASEQVRRDDRDAKLRTIGAILLVICVGFAYVWLVAR